MQCKSGSRGRPVWAWRQPPCCSARRPQCRDRAIDHRTGRYRLDDLGDRACADDVASPVWRCSIAAWCARRMCLPPWRRRCCHALGSVLWVVVGYTLTFSGDGALIGNLDRVFFRGIGMRTTSALRRDHPGIAVCRLSDDVCGDHRGAGGGLGRRSHAILRFRLVRGAVAAVVYVPIAHWVWGGGFLMQSRACSILPAAPSFISMPVWPDWLPPMSSAHGAAMAARTWSPHDLSLAVIGTGFCGSAGSASTAARRSPRVARRVRNHCDAFVGVSGRGHLDGVGMVDPR